MDYSETLLEKICRGILELRTCFLGLPPEEIDDQQDHNTEKLSRDTGVDSPGKKLARTWYEIMSEYNFVDYVNLRCTLS